MKRPNHDRTIRLKVKRGLLYASLVMFMASTAQLQASYKTYEAELDISQWQLDGNPLGCRLSHQVPYYGKAEFSQQGGRKQALGFALGYKRHKITATRVASVRSISPAWLPQQTSRELGEVKINPGNPIIQTGSLASWRLLNELEVGRFPTFSYQEFADPQDQVSVALSAVGFKPAYDRFLDCLNSLVAYDLNQLRKMTLHFDFDKARVKTGDRPKLEALANYIKYDTGIEVVFISGYTDSKGSHNYNQKLSAKRIASVQNILSLDGVDSARFKTFAFGENNPVASNRKAAGRAKNRRVYIRISQK